MESANQALLEKFYQALQAKDVAGLTECYHPEAEFTDEVFKNLKGKEVTSMWKMLFERGKDMTLVYRDVQAGPESGSGHWDATYTYSQTGRKVINRINSAFQFKDGRIFKQRDTFDLWKWSRQALGISGLLLGWSGPLQKTVRKRASQALQGYIKKNQG